MAKPDFPTRAARPAHPLARQPSGQRAMKTRFKTVLVALMASLCALALVPAAQASADSGQSGLVGPRTWHVLVGGQSKDKAIQAEGYYPHVITIDAGDTVA